VTLVDTGQNTQTGGRLKRVRKYIDGTFCFTYGDGLSDVNISNLLAFHREQGTQATLTAVQPPGRFGVIDFKEEKISAFHEKPSGEGGWINGGFFVLEPDVIDLVEGDATSWEREPLEHLAQAGQLSAHKHAGFWQPMDTLRDRTYLESLWTSGKAPWKVW
jgi:glucose-1-phosphate cytidylyltransferase